MLSPGDGEDRQDAGPRPSPGDGSRTVVGDNMAGQSGSLVGRGPNGRRETGLFAKDPVCGRDVELARAAGHVEHDRRGYYFCSGQCEQDFKAKPGRYLPER